MKLLNVEYLEYLAMLNAYKSKISSITTLFNAIALLTIETSRKTKIKITHYVSTLRIIFALLGVFMRIVVSCLETPAALYYIVTQYKLTMVKKCAQKFSLVAVHLNTKYIETSFTIFF